ncbi:MAG: hypothetical protein AVDCRST_MAG07-1996 [uncultured Frankineae bacterium]|uniref:Uncharacterized protein n=1 Tax=uncultured Frankineae bacterium TaxID=437475 RepID=A0A6J4LLJ7_9ACTN|nr:MAG: hypothetical protein AVDCRST_MAG07-1996 [uncultured Frankineae bacterium]
MPSCVGDQLVCGSDTARLRRHRVPRPRRRRVPGGDDVDDCPSPR